MSSAVMMTAIAMMPTVTVFPCFTGRLESRLQPLVFHK
jgi:hypothetical protein